MYKSTHYNTEVIILQKIVKLCELDEHVGIVDWFPAPVIEVGIISKQRSKNKTLKFKKGSVMTIWLFNEDKKSLFESPEKPCADYSKRISDPLLAKQKEVMRLLINQYPKYYKSHSVESYEKTFGEKF